VAAAAGVSLPVRNAVRRWRRPVGMVVGVSIALSFVMILMGLLGGSMGNLVGDFPQSGANLYVAVNGGQLIPLQHGSNPCTIDGGTSVLATVRGLPGVRGAVGELSWPHMQEREGPLARYEAAQFVPAIAVDGDPYPVIIDLAKPNPRLRPGMTIRITFLEQST
jgi:hypothetical protein